METPVFDSSRPITINLRTPAGVKTVRVRFPSDDEWAERQRRRKVLIKQLERGVSEMTVANGEDVDTALVAKIRTEDAPEIDAFEAMKVVEQLSQADVDDVVPAGDSFRVTLRLLGPLPPTCLRCSRRRMSSITGAASPGCWTCRCGQFRPLDRALQNSNLVAQRKNLQLERSTAPKRGRQ